MENISVAIVEDNDAVRERLADLTHAVNPQAQVSVFATAEQFAAHRAEADIVFMDIGLKGMNGIDAAKRLRATNKDCVLIFVTGLRERVYEAMDAHPFQYLVKPVDAATFRHTYMEAAEEALRRGTARRKKILIHTRTSDVLVDVAQIMYVESKTRKVAIHTSSDVYEMYGTISELQSQLGSTFYRSHRAFLVNMEHVRSYSATDIELSNGDHVFLTRKKHADFAREYMWFLKEHHVVV